MVHLPNVYKTVSDKDSSERYWGDPSNPDFLADAKSEMSFPSDPETPEQRRDRIVTASAIMGVVALAIITATLFSI